MAAEDAPFRLISGDDESRRGHVPGARHVDLERDLSKASEFSDSGVGPGEPVVAYCGAGVAGSNVGFARLLLGYADVSLYDGSMLEWSSDPDRPVVSIPAMT